MQRAPGQDEVEGLNRYIAHLAFKNNDPTSRLLRKFIDLLADLITRHATGDTLTANTRGRLFADAANYTDQLDLSLIERARDGFRKVPTNLSRNLNSDYAIFKAHHFWFELLDTIFHDERRDA